jgi:hypothetical protein
MSTNGFSRFAPRKSARILRTPRVTESDVRAKHTRFLKHVPPSIKYSHLIGLINNVNDRTFVSEYVDKNWEEGIEPLGVNSYREVISILVRYLNELEIPEKGELIVEDYEQFISVEE